MKMNASSTLERWSKKTRYRKALQKEREELLLSELMTALMQEDQKTVRGLAEEVDLSPTVIQKLRSGKQHDLRVKNLLKILNVFGYHIELVKGRKRLLFAL